MSATNRNYPLIEHPELLHSANGRPLAEMTLENAVAGELSGADMLISAAALRAQAAIARAHGYEPLAENLERAAELTEVPNDELLRMYEMLRPDRSTFEELTDLAERLETEFAAPANGRLVREAATVYRERRLVRNDSDD